MRRTRDQTALSRCCHPPCARTLPRTRRTVVTVSAALQPKSKQLLPGAASYQMIVNQMFCTLITRYRDKTNLGPVPATGDARKAELLQRIEGRNLVFLTGFTSHCEYKSLRLLSHLGSNWTKQLKSPPDNGNREIYSGMGPRFGFHIATVILFCTQLGRPLWLAIAVTISPQRG